MCRGLGPAGQNHRVRDQPWLGLHTAADGCPRGELRDRGCRLPVPDVRHHGWPASRGLGLRGARHAREPEGEYRDAKHSGREPHTPHGVPFSIDADPMSMDANRELDQAGWSRGFEVLG